jgi:hypothetical protein
MLASANEGRATFTINFAERYLLPAFDKPFYYAVIDKPAEVSCEALE